MFPYVSPEQQMKDRADFARKGIARGRAVVGVVYGDGVLFVAENPSSSLYKISELYDRLAFAAVGRYNEFESLRRQGIRLADVLGYQYARQDVTGRSMANAYASALGTAFSESSKPFEVELLVAEVLPASVDLFHILYDGSISVEEGFVAIGGEADAISTALSERFERDSDQQTALRAAHGALNSSVDDREITPDRLEVAGLDRSRARRKFFRLTQDAVRDALTD